MKANPPNKLMQLGDEYRTGKIERKTYIRRRRKIIDQITATDKRNDTATPTTSPAAKPRTTEVGDNPDQYGATDRTIVDPFEETQPVHAQEKNRGYGGLLFAFFIVAIFLIGAYYLL